MAGSGGGIRGSQKDVKKIEENQERAFRRAKSMVRELIIENNLKYTWHITYAENEESRSRAIEDFKYFIKKLNKHIGTKIPYVATMEIQKEREKKYGYKVIHFHMAVDRYIDYYDMYRLWGKGHLVYTVPEGKPDPLAAASYITKYLTKDVKEDEVREPGQKRYLNSRGLKRADRDKVIMLEGFFEELRKISENRVEFETAEWLKIRKGQDKVG